MGMEVRFLNPDEYELWNSHVDLSPQGSIESKTYWLNLVAENFKIVGCFKNNTLMGGLAFEEKKLGPFMLLLNPQLTQFLGIIYRNNSNMNPLKKTSLEKKILTSILEFLESRYDRLAINNHYSIDDVRPFIWRNYQIIVRYSLVLPLDKPDKVFDQFETRTKTDIRKCLKNGVKVEEGHDIEAFHELHELTFRRQGRKCPISLSLTKSVYSSLKALDKAKLYFTIEPKGNIAAAIFIVWDSGKSYYLMGANHPEYRHYSSSSLAIWQAIRDMVERDIKEFDLYGANTETISFYKRGFGGELKSYYRAINNNTLIFRLIDEWRRIIQGNKDV